MSEELFSIVKTFVEMKGNPEDFVDKFIDEWKRERDNGKGLADPPKLSEVLSSIFCLADMFNPGDDRESYELDERKLRLGIEEILKLCE